MCFKIVGNEPADFVLFGVVVGSVHLDVGLVSSKPHASGSSSHVFAGNDGERANTTCKSTLASL